MLEQKIQMKTDDMEKHSNLLLTRVLQELNVDVRNGAEKEILVAMSEENRVIGLGYDKASTKPNSERVWTVRVVLLDGGENSIQDCYYDEASTTIVHDVVVQGINVLHNGEPIKFEFEKLEKINKQVLLDMKKPLNVSLATIYGREWLNIEKPFVAVHKEDSIEQLKQVAVDFVKKNKKEFPKEFTGNIKFLESIREYNLEVPKGKISVIVESYDFVDCIWEDEDGNEIDRDITKKYRVCIYAENQSEIILILSDLGDTIDTEYEEYDIYEVETITATINVGDGYFDMGIWSEYEERKFMRDFSNINQRYLAKKNNIDKCAIK